MFIVVHHHVLLLFSITQLTVFGQRFPSSTQSDRYEIEILKAINLRRTAHCAPPLTLDPNLNEIAQNFAQYLCKTKNFVPSGIRYRGEQLGETLYATTASFPLNVNDLQGSEPVQYWYKGEEIYNYRLPGFSTSTGSFTQMVWASSESLGIGYCCSSDRYTCYTVAHYYPSGNYVGRYAANVQPESCISSKY